MASISKIEFKKVPSHQTTNYSKNSFGDFLPSKLFLSYCVFINSNLVHIRFGKILENLPKKSVEKTTKSH